MISCERTLAQRLLRDELSQEEQRKFEEHLDTCVQCQSWLTEESGGEALEQHVRSQLESSLEVVSWAESSNEFHKDSRFSAKHRENRRHSLPHKLDTAILTPSDDPASLGRIGLFEVRGVIGRGGMGTVYKAIDPSLARTIAIKILNPAMADLGTARQRFALEARAMAAVTHPHVVPIYTVDEHQGLPYMAMEYVSGGTLEERLTRQGPVDVLAAIRIAHQVAQALAAAHDCGLVHRDIKPGNILLDRGIERVRVADFGLVRVSDDASLTHSGVIAGTPQFMAPEQVRGEACDARADLFSLGSVMYALCAGHSPFRADSPYAAMQRIVHETHRPLRERNAQVPRWLEAFVDRLLEKRPADRFQSAHEIATLLESELAHWQNPTLIQAPSRNWMKQPVAPESRSRKLWTAISHSSAFPYAICALLVCVLIAVSSESFNPVQTMRRWLGNEPEMVNKMDKVLEPLGKDEIDPLLNANILWQRDGFQNFQNAMMVETLKTLRNDSELPDPLQNKIRELESQLRALENTADR